MPKEKPAVPAVGTRVTASTMRASSRREFTGTVTEHKETIRGLWLAVTDADGTVRMTRPALVKVAA